MQSISLLCQTGHLDRTPPTTDHSIFIMTSEAGCQVATHLQVLHFGKCAQCMHACWLTHSLALTCLQERCCTLVPPV